MRKNEKQRFDFDLDFFIGFASGVAANLLAQYAYDKWLVPLIKKNEQGMGKMTFWEATRNLWSIISGQVGSTYSKPSPLDTRPKTQNQWGGTER